MKLYLVKDGGRAVWVAALGNETMYGYVPNTGKFHDNHALRNDFYQEQDFSYTEIGSAEARRLIDTEITPFDENEYAEVLAKWRADTRGIDAAEILAMAAALNY